MAVTNPFDVYAPGYRKLVSFKLWVWAASNLSHENRIFTAFGPHLLGVCLRLVVLQVCGMFCKTGEGRMLLAVPTGLLWGTEES